MIAERAAAALRDLAADWDALMSARDWERDEAVLSTTPPSHERVAELQQLLDAECS